MGDVLTPEEREPPTRRELADKAADHRWKAAEALIHCDIPRHLKHTRVARWGVRRRGVGMGPRSVGARPSFAREYP
jgi:hypothetical protein